MIEKFSDEELKQIIKELGIDKNNTKAFKSTVCSEEKIELCKLWGEKVSKLSETSEELLAVVYKVIDITLCNFREKIYKRKNKSGGTYEQKYVGFDSNIKQEDIDEYRQMFQEILEIIKKHNREWNGSGLA